MSSFQPRLKAGMVYSEGLAALLGVARVQCLELMPPLLGAALDIKAGNRGGNICHLHVFFDSSLALRLPSATASVSEC